VAVDPAAVNRTRVARPATARARQWAIARMAGIGRPAATIGRTRPHVPALSAMGSRLPGVPGTGHARVSRIDPSNRASRARASAAQLQPDVPPVEPTHAHRIIAPRTRHIGPDPPGRGWMPAPSLTLVVRSGAWTQPIWNGLNVASPCSRVSGSCARIAREFRPPRRHRPERSFERSSRPSTSAAGPIGVFHCTKPGGFRRPESIGSIIGSMSDCLSCPTGAPRS